MPNVRNADDWANEGLQLNKDAIAILENPEEMSAEDIEHVQKLRDGAGEAFDRSQLMRDMQDEKAIAIAQFKEQDENKQTKDAKNQLDIRNEFKSFGHFLRAVNNIRNNGYGDDRLKWLDGVTNQVFSVPDIKALAENTGATGGFLVPAEFANRLMSVLEGDTIVFSRAEIIRMSSRTITIPVVDQTNTTSGTAPWFGGMVASWIGEGSTMAESDPAFRDLTLNAHELSVYTRVSNQLLDDSAQSLEDFLTGDRGFVGLFAYTTDRAYLQGDGNGKPLGVISSGAATTATRAGGNLVDYTDLTEMLTNFLPSGRGVWVAHQTVLDQLLQMAGPSGNPVYLWGSPAAGVPNTLLGMPIEFTDRVPTLGSLGDIGLYDFSFYLIGDRQEITIDSSAHERFQQNQTSWRAIMRVDGRPWLSAPITYEDGSTTVSPFSLLAA